MDDHWWHWWSVHFSINNTQSNQQEDVFYKARGPTLLNLTQHKSFVYIFGNTRPRQCTLLGQPNNPRVCINLLKQHISPPMLRRRTCFCQLFISHLDQDQDGIQTTRPTWVLSRAQLSCACKCTKFQMLLSHICDMLMNFTLRVIKSSSFLLFLCSSKQQETVRSTLTYTIIISTSAYSIHCKFSTQFTHHHYQTLHPQGSWLANVHSTSCPTDSDICVLTYSSPG